MKTMMVDGMNTLVDDEVSGERLSSIANCDHTQFPIIVRNQGAVPERIPVQNSTHKYALQDGDELRRMYRVVNGG
jgi:hypothetical protein